MTDKPQEPDLTQTHWYLRGKLVHVGESCPVTETGWAPVGRLTLINNSGFQVQVTEPLPNPPESGS